MAVTYKALSALLSYPSAELKEAAGEISQVLADEGILPKAALAELAPLIQEMAEWDLYALQERYVLLFDRSRTLSLNLFEHVHGESRDRGPAMVDLVETYREGGFEMAATELPDHLPILLEFMSTRTDQAALELLQDAGTIIAALAERLIRRETPYATVLTALADLAGVSKTDEPVAELLSVADDDPEDLQALDDVWQEAEVTFGPDPNAGCPVSRDMLANMDPNSSAQATPAARN